MKHLILTCFSFFCITCYGQYNINLESISTSKFAITDNEKPPNDILIKEVKPNVNIKLAINGAKEIKSIHFVGIEGKLIEVDKSSFESKATQVFRINYKGKKMQWKNNPNELNYPYKIIVVDIKNNKCELKLGHKSLTKEPKAEVLTSNIDLLNETNLDPSLTTIDIDVCSMMDNSNALLLLDCSPFLSSKSKLYRKGKKCKSQKTLKVGDYLRVYLYNFNRYRYDVEINNTFIDDSYGQSDIIPNQPKNETKDKEPAGAVSTQNDIFLQSLSNMAQAATQLYQFIVSVKTSAIPDSKTLDSNKKIIEQNLKNSGLIPIDQTIAKKYNALPPEDQKKYKNVYDSASKLKRLYAAFQLLSYTIEATILPIQIKSYDKFSLTITLKDTKTGKEVNKQEYNYLIRGGFKIDQSFGINLHGIKDIQFSLRPFMANDTIYALKSNGERLQVELEEGIFKDSIASIVSGVRNEILKADTSNFQTIGLTTLTHFYYRWFGCFSVGPEVGISADIYPKTDLRYLLGLGILFKDGRYRISLDVGFAFGKYKDFGAGQDYGTILKGQGVTPIFDDKFASKLYFGISYNVPINASNSSEQKAKI